MMPRSLIAAACLASGLLFSACPQATPTLAPGVYNAGDPSSSKDRPEEAPPSDPGSEAPPAPNFQGDGSSAAGGSSTGIDSLRDGPGVEAVEDRTWAVQPIEPKSDQRGVEDPFALKDARLRYGKNFGKILGKSVPAARALESPMAPVTLRFKMDVIALTDDWEPLIDFFFGKPQLRVVYVPKGKPASAAKYADAEWEVAGDGSILYTFSGLKVGEGDLIFAIAHPNELRDVLDETTSDYHTGALIPLPSGNPSQPFPAGEGPVYALGSFRLIGAETQEP